MIAALSADAQKILVQLQDNYLQADAPKIYAQYLLETAENDSSLSHPTSKHHGQLLYWLRLEVQSLVCTKSAKYKNERAFLATSVAPAVALLSATMVQNFGLSPVTATALVSIALYLPFKLGVNAWCQMVSKSPKEITKEENDLVHDLLPD